MRSFVFVASAALALTSCQSAAEMALDITAGQETDAFTADPAVTTIDIAVSSLDGSVNVQASTTPGGTFDLGDIPIDQSISVEVTGSDAGGNTVMRGRSLAGLPLQGITGDLPIFIQRTNAFARPPDGLAQTHVGGVAATLGERYLLLTGGSAASSATDSPDMAQADAYDVLSLSGASSSTPFSRTAKSIISLGDVLLLVGDDGASWVDYAQGVEYDAALPDGLTSFGDVAGAVAIAGSDDTAFLVGGTRRDGDPSSAVLAVAADGTLTAFQTGTPRLGAAALWIDTVGLVVAGGSADGPGVEVLAGGATTFAPRGYAPDPTTFAGAVTDGAVGLVLLGGVNAGAAALPRLIDPACISACAAKEIPEAAFPDTLVRVTAYALGGTKVIAVGDEAEGEGLTRTFIVDLTGGVTELPLREPRRGAVPLPTPLGTLALLGGEHPDGTPATSVETFFPE